MFAISTDNDILNQVAEERMIFAKVSRGHEAHEKSSNLLDGHRRVIKIVS
jgi:hypothetical protein